MRKSNSTLLLMGVLACTTSDQPKQSVRRIAGESQIVVSPQEIARAAMASVVVLTTQDAQGQALALGTGFFVAPGVIATNAHVIQGATSATAKGLTNAKPQPIGGVVALDAMHDVTLLSVSTSAPSLPISSGSMPEIGATVYALGNPEGLEGTFSAGMVSAKRVVTGDTLLQITAPISHGSSGGPVLDEKGAVVGIATAAFKEGQNLNFAVPASWVAALLVTRHDPVPIQTVGNRAQAKASVHTGQGAVAVVAENFEWSSEYDNGYASDFTFGLRNKSSDSVTVVRCLVVFYDDVGRPLQSVPVTFVGDIPPGLAERVFSSVQPSVKRLTTSLARPYIFARHPRTRLELRVLDYRNSSDYPNSK
jgi:S1-C subfamily serine protease